MVSDVATARGLITRFCKLGRLGALAKKQNKQLDSVQVIIENHSRNVNLGNLCRLEGAVVTIESINCQVDKALGDLSLLAEKEEKVDPSEIDQYVGSCGRILVSAVEYVALLHKLIIARQRGHLAIRTEAWQRPHNQEHQQVELPPLPIPKLTVILLNALEGEAKESVKKFQVTPENYSHAIKFLHARYGNPEELIQKLIDKLDHYKLRRPTHTLRTGASNSPATKAKGEHVDSQVMVKKVLSKFPAHIQRRVLAKRRTLPSTTSSTMETLFNIIEDVLSEEEMMNLYMIEPMSTSQNTSAKDFERRPMFRRASARSAEVYTSHLVAMHISPERKGEHKTFECKRKIVSDAEDLTSHHTTSTSNNAQEMKEQVVDAIRTDNKVKKQVKRSQKVNVVAEEGKIKGGESPILEIQAAQEI
ncbi:hypothetical protein COOONC_26914 [Cooperia oncophora]